MKMKRIATIASAIAAAVALAVGSAGPASARDWSGGATATCSSSYGGRSVVAKSASSSAWGYYIAHSYSVGGRTYTRTWTGTSSATLQYRQYDSTHLRFDSWKVSAEVITTAYTTCWAE